MPDNTAKRSTPFFKHTNNFKTHYFIKLVKIISRKNYMKLFSSAWKHFRMKSHKSVKYCLKAFLSKVPSFPLFHVQTLMKLYVRRTKNKHNSEQNGSCKDISLQIMLCRQITAARHFVPCQSSRSHPVKQSSSIYGAWNFNRGWQC